MLAVVLIAGIALLSAGLVAIGFGVPVKEFSFGNTLILAGTALACTGALMLALWMVVRELQNMARQIARGAGASQTMSSGDFDATPDDHAPDDVSFLSGRDQPALAKPGRRQGAGLTPWHDDSAARDRGRYGEPAIPGPAEVAPAPAVRRGRDLLFSSTSRKERERAQARMSDLSSAAAPASEPTVPPPASFENAWPKPDRPRLFDVPPLRRAGRAPSFADTGVEAADYPPAAEAENPAEVTVIKSGTVDGMAYSLYSDGSIEAQMPEGMMRFASLDELRAHLDLRA